MRGDCLASFGGGYRLFLERLKQARIEAGLTQSAVARHLRRPQSFVSKAESGERRQTSGSQTVTVQDTTPPVINSIVANPSTLWPPNHNLVPVSITATATDICNTSPKCNIVSVTSNEPVLGPGSGNTSPDWVLNDPGPKVSPAKLGIQLRAERAGGGAGRVYTINVLCSDASGNTTPGKTTVSVGHDQR
jgi:hypothetical protein